MNLASIFNLGGPDLIVILLIVLLLFGAKKLPELARGMGQAMKEFNKAKDEFEHEVTKTTSPSSEVVVREPLDRQPQTKPVTPVEPPVVS